MYVKKQYVTAVFVQSSSPAEKMWRLCVAGNLNMNQ